MPSKLELDDVIKRGNIIHNNYYDYSLVDYINNNTKIKIICPIHGIFEQTPSSHLNNKSGCPKCSKNTKPTILDFINKAKLIHNNKYNYSLVNYINAKTKVKIICPIHGIFEQIPDNHIRKKYGCPKCNDSRGEKIIQTFLENNNIIYTTQKSFDGCKYKQLLKFDFYLPELNTCIEYDGEQHFHKYRFEKDNKKLEIRQLRDKIKSDFCEVNNIKIIRISYKNKIEEILNKLDILI